MNEIDVRHIHVLEFPKQLLWTDRDLDYFLEEMSSEECRMNNALYDAFLQEMKEGQAYSPEEAFNLAYYECVRISLARYPESKDIFDVLEMDIQHNQSHVSYGFTDFVMNMVWAMLHSTCTAKRFSSKLHSYLANTKKLKYAFRRFFAPNDFEHNIFPYKEIEEPKYTIKFGPCPVDIDYRLLGGEWRKLTIGYKEHLIEELLMLWPEDKRESIRKCILDEKAGQMDNFRNYVKKHVVEIIDEPESHVHINLKERQDNPINEDDELLLQQNAELKAEINKLAAERCQRMITVDFLHKKMTDDEKYMRRCLQLAGNGLQNARPNPMVGAVIVADGRIIGEGYHVRCGQGHAEVNAFASVSADDERLLPQATIYVSLEPCSHYGKTPPCADLIIKKGVRRVVVGCQDDFAQVQGRGIRKLREAGVEVTVGVLEEECRELNRRFFTFHRMQRPYMLLKWCQSADGFIDDHFRPTVLSSPFTQMLSHKLRAEEDAILVGRVTDERDHPQLNVRHWCGPDPKRMVIDRRHPLHLQSLHAQNVQSLIVEGGAATLQSLLDQDLWDEIRVETALARTLGGGTRAPRLPSGVRVVGTQLYDQNLITVYRK